MDIDVGSVDHALTTTRAVRLRYTLRLGPGPSGITEAIERMPDKEPRILHRRVEEHRANMQRVVDGIKAATRRDPVGEQP
jgi:hypothetical protein